MCFKVPEVRRRFYVHANTLAFQEGVDMGRNHTTDLIYVQQGPQGFGELEEDLQVPELALEGFLGFLALLELLL